MVVRRRLDIKGPALFFVTTTVTDWTPVFDNEVIALTALRQFRETLSHFQVCLTGNVLMPSHLHVLLGLEEASGLSHFMQSFKILSSKKLKALPEINHYGQLRLGGTFRLWKPRFDDLLIKTEEQFRIKLAYIHNNPVKARLVSSAEQWPYSSASDWDENRPGILPVVKDFRWYR